MATQPSRTLADEGFGFRMESLTSVHWLLAVLAIITGAVHVYLYTLDAMVPFLLAGVIFFAAVVAMALNVFRRLLYAIGILFVAGQIVLWILAGTPHFTIGVLDKVVQVAMLVVLGYLLYTGD
ncbi:MULTISPECIES: hypothetical protein [unclassified Haladaptatus]|uniref:hypothetical protein n=1 Tax=unclassified Haladaptatus TaxID=2622732 RepID=UPI0023E89ACA|nr:MULTISPECIES: hypothetical protein [unclassified Haladaptatus]